MSIFKFGQMNIASKDFYKHKQVTDIATMDISKVSVSDKVSCNNGKDWKYVIGYQHENTIIPLLVKTPKNVFSYGISQCDKNATYTISFNVADKGNVNWLDSYQRIWQEIESQIFETLSKEPVRDNKYLKCKLKTWKERINTNFHGKTVPHDTYCTATGILKIDSVYSQGKNFYPQAYLEECKYIENSTQTCTLLSDSEDEGFVAL